MYKKELTGHLFPYFLSYFILEDLPWIQAKQIRSLNNPAIQVLITYFAAITTHNQIYPLLLLVGYNYHHYIFNRIFHRRSLIFFWNRLPQHNLDHCINNSLLLLKQHLIIHLQWLIHCWQRWWQWTFYRCNCFIIFFDM